MKSFYLLLAVLLLSASNIQSSFAQCACTYTITGNSGTYYNLNAGETLCIKSGANFNGGVGLNGGTICNSGTISGGYINFSSGAFYNNGTITDGGMGMSNGIFQNNGTISGGNYSFSGGTAYNNGSFSGGGLTVSGATFFNYGSIASGINFSLNSGVFNNHSDWTKSNGLSIGGTFNNYAALTVNGDLNINNGGVLNNESTLSLSGNLNNNYQFYNNGRLTIGGNYSANSNSVNQNNSSLVLNGNFDVNSAVSNNGTFSIGGYIHVNSSGSLTTEVGSSMQIQGVYENNSLTLNNGTIEVGGSFVNSSSGNFTNNNYMNVLGNFTNNGPINGDNVGCNVFTVFGNSIVQNSSGSLNSIDFCGNAVFNNFSTNYGTVNGNVTFCTCTPSGGGVTPLPIILKSFTAACNQGEVELAWVTLTEINNAFFTISRSANAIDWETIDVQEGAGSSNSELAYNYTDTRPVEGVLYYRLQQTDFDGTSEVFTPVSVSCNDNNAASTISVYPNPANESFNISVIASKPDPNAFVEIFDIAGFKAMSTKVSLTDGANTIPILVESLAAGTYLVRVVSAGSILGVQKVILQ